MVVENPSGVALAVVGGKGSVTGGPVVTATGVEEEGKGCMVLGGTAKGNKFQNADSLQHVD